MEIFTSVVVSVADQMDFGLAAGPLPPTRRLTMEFLGRDAFCPCSKNFQSSRCFWVLCVGGRVIQLAGWIFFGPQSR